MDAKIKSVTSPTCVSEVFVSEEEETYFYIPQEHLSVDNVINVLTKINSHAPMP